MLKLDAFQLWEGACPPIAVCQEPITQLIHRNRGQAPSHIQASLASGLVTFLGTSATNGISLPSASNSLPPLK
ncbi:hypothetical protein SAMN05428951_11558 [Pseudomonas sp. OV546]|nr:hypothetical protein SAMN05428951_11558 [Pseudomonas sp. OV546]